MFYIYCITDIEYYIKNTQGVYVQIWIVKFILLNINYKYYYVCWLNQYILIILYIHYSIYLPSMLHLNLNYYISYIDN